MSRDPIGPTTWDAFRIGGCRVEIDRRRVRSRHGERAVPPKAMEVLLALAGDGGRVVGKDALLERVWADTAVGEQVLTTAVWQLRDAFAAVCPGVEFIETVPRSGYRLIPPVVRQPRAAAPPPPPAAVACHHRGRVAVRGPGFAEVERGVRQLEEASRRWPAYAPLHADLALGLYTLARWGRSPGEPLLVAARAAAERALALEPDLHSAAAVAALIELGLGGALAEAAGRLAELAVEHGEPEVLDALARCRAASGRADDALELERRALESDPLSPSYNTTLGFLLRLGGRWEEAERQLQQTLELAPGWGIAAAELARARVGMGDLPGAAAVLGDTEAEWAELVRALQRGDQVAVAGLVDGWLEERDGYVAPYWLAERCVWAHRYCDAIRCLERARRERQVHLMFVAVDPAFAPLHDHVGFQRLVISLRAQGEGGTVPRDDGATSELPTA